MAAPDLTPLATAINFSTTTIAVLAVGVSIIGLVIIVNAYIYIKSLITGKVYFAGEYWDKDIYKKGIEEVNRKIRRGELVDKQSRDAWRSYSGIGTQRRKRIF